MSQNSLILLFMIGDLDPSSWWIPERVQVVYLERVLLHHGLLVDIKNHQLIYRLTSISFESSSSNGPHLGLKPSSDTSPYHELLYQFPSLTNPAFLGIGHGKPDVTKGPPVFAQARDFLLKKQVAAKKKIQSLLDRYIICPSNSRWSSSIHMAIKKNGEYRGNVETIVDLKPS
ncbi:hypothetical protein TNIN_365091 [Trichonephila inaurata madagascariensis]|uniref:Uncharacterized protein n=1 Tax=Trichonephila inaurata madagascariensis TaxID=2747483 RepID=A0A8X6MH06_9ARAC|nr:hypothetical protein TNIN_365091 [Trichonephila inaurata madagascariensis]